MSLIMAQDFAESSRWGVTGSEKSNQRREDNKTNTKLEPGLQSGLSFI